MTTFSTLYILTLGLSFVTTTFAQPSGEGESEGGEDSGEDSGESGEDGSSATVDYSYINGTVFSSYYGSTAANGYTFTMDVALDCSRVTYTFVDTDGDVYTSWGIGGDYSGNEANKMDGYCIIVQDGYTWETTLDGDNQPIEQDSQDLTCSQTVVGNTRTTECRRDYTTGDNEDFDTYAFGTNEVIYADGSVMDGVIIEHAGPAAGETTMEVVGMGCQNLSSYAYYAGASVDDIVMQWSVDFDCTTMTFEFVDEPGLMYSSWGLGGDYTLSGRNLMNGYAIIIENGDAWETTLEAGADPERQDSQDLTCSQSTVDGKRYTSCTRDYDTGDSEDWFDFKFYWQDFIYAWGDVVNGSETTLVEHGHDDAGTVNAFVYGEGCGGVKASTTPAPTAMPITDPPSKSPTPEPVGDGGNCANCEDDGASSATVMIAGLIGAIVMIMLY